ncbi:unnamed protein product, partial [Candidula unifasciata]
KCAFGYYTYPNGTRYTARMVFDQETQRCALEAAYCPRIPQNYSEVQNYPDTDSFTELNKRSCIRNEHDCVGKKTGDYRACSPECKRGVYYSCSYDVGYR